MNNHVSVQSARIVRCMHVVAYPKGICCCQVWEMRALAPAEFCHCCSSLPEVASGRFLRLHGSRESGQVGGECMVCMVVRVCRTTAAQGVGIEERGLGVRGPVIAEVALFWCKVTVYGVMVVPGVDIGILWLLVLGHSCT